MASPASVLALSQPHRPWLYHPLLMCDFEMGFNRIIQTDSMRTITSSPECPIYTIFTSQEIFSAILELFHCLQFNIVVDYHLSKTN